MHKGTEIDFVLNDSLKALELYQTIFDEIQLIEATDYPRGNN
ncbi:TPA: VOC family protein, partial [Enterococcus faecium]|nr:VOC family protein [Enterococcus faecium]